MRTLALDMFCFSVDAVDVATELNWPVYVSTPAAPAASPSTCTSRIRSSRSTQPTSARSAMARCAAVLPGEPPLQAHLPRCTPSKIASAATPHRRCTVLRGRSPPAAAPRGSSTGASRGWTRSRRVAWCCSASGAWAPFEEIAVRLENPGRGRHACRCIHRPGSHDYRD
jgi:hypothetical protein